MRFDLACSSSGSIDWREDTFFSTSKMSGDSNSAFCVLGDVMKYGEMTAQAEDVGMVWELYKGACRSANEGMALSRTTTIELHSLDDLELILEGLAVLHGDYALLANLRNDIEKRKRVRHGACPQLPSRPP